MIAIKTPGLHMLGGLDDVAVLWDIRVSPRERGRGTGSALFRAAETWAGARGCRWLKIETQNINVPACRFYQKMGCTLGAFDRFAYPPSRPRYNCCGGRRWHRLTRNPADPISALNRKLLRPLPASQQIGGQSRLASKCPPLMPK